MSIDNKITGQFTVLNMQWCSKEEDNWKKEEEWIYLNTISDSYTSKRIKFRNGVLYISGSSSSTHTSTTRRRRRRCQITISSIHSPFPIHNPYPHNKQTRKNYSAISRTQSTHSALRSVADLVNLRKEKMKPSSDFWWLFLLIQQSILFYHLFSYYYYTTLFNS